MSEKDSITTEVPREVTGPFPYVWLEIHEIQLCRETTTPERGIGIKDWPVTSDLENQIQHAKDTHGLKSAMLMRKETWERERKYEAVLRRIARAPLDKEGCTWAADQAKMALGDLL